VTLDPAPLALEPTTPSAAFRGEARVVKITAGVPAGGVVTDGSVAPGDVTVVLEIELDAGSPEHALAIGVTMPSVGTAWTGIGRIPGAGADFLGELGAEGASFLSAAGLAPGEIADRIFLSLPALLAGATFDVVLLGAPDGEQAAARGTFGVMPEPATAALVLVGLAGLARRPRRPR
jgi:hypothetical protein